MKSCPVKKDSWYLNLRKCTNIVSTILKNDPSGKQKLNRINSEKCVKFKIRPMLAACMAFLRGFRKIEFAHFKKAMMKSMLIIIRFGIRMINSNSRIIQEK